MGRQTILRALLAPAVGVILAHSASGVAVGADKPNGVQEEYGDQFSVHWQATYIEQETSGFTAPYSGPNSLSPHAGKETVDITLFAGSRLWSGAEAWINPEIDQGFGLNGTLGVAGFPSGEAYRVGKNQPYFRLPRAFVRHSVNLDDTRQAIVGGANQFEGYRSPNCLVFTVGKFSVTDIFDTNQYAHDPRGDFVNWAIVDAGSFDYAADAWGFTVGAAIEWYQGTWTLRAGAFDLSDVPNSAHLDPGFHELLGLPGRILLTVFDTRGRIGLLDDAVRLAQATGSAADISAVRRYRARVGASLSLEQPLSSTFGMFARAGTAGGNVETYEFTDIDRTISAGLSLKGSRWRRADDIFGLAVVINRISAARERFLNAGGLGIVVGDGQLPHPGPEQILETYYRLSVFDQAHLTLDYQWVSHPGYNRDRGPVSIIAVRMHVQF